MAFRTTVFLFSFVVLSLADNLFHLTGNVEYNGPALNHTFGPFNVYNTATLSVTQTANLPISVCVVYAAYGLPAKDQYHEDNCLFFFNSSTAISSPLALRNAQYVIGVFFSTPEGKTGPNSTSVTVDLEGSSCAAGSYWDGSACAPAGVIPDWSHYFEADFEKGQTKFWTFEAPNYVGHINVSMVDGFDVSADVAEIWARFNAVPSGPNHDAMDTNGDLVVVSPRPGTWVFAVHSPEGGHGKFYLSGQVCGLQSGGIGCMVPVLPMNNNASLVIQQTPWFFQLNAVVGYPLIVSITTADGNNIPFLYASKGVIPTAPSANLKDSADVLNCNGGYCDTVRTITFNVTGEEEWFFGVFPVPGTPNATFGIWYNSTCVYDCEKDNHGSCLPSGRCECEIDFEGVDCSISKGLGPQYIVLIIIASLVVASAIIGFVAWAYLRKKRAAYEIVQ